MGDTGKSSVTFFLKKLAYAAYIRTSPINGTRNNPQFFIAQMNQQPTDFTSNTISKFTSVLCAQFRPKSQPSLTLTNLYMNHLEWSSMTVPQVSIWAMPR